MWIIFLLKGREVLALHFCINISALWIKPTCNVDEDDVYSDAARGPDAAEGEISVLGPCGWAIRKRESRDTQEMS